MLQHVCILGSASRSHCGKLSHGKSQQCLQLIIACHISLCLNYVHCRFGRNWAFELLEHAPVIRYVNLRSRFHATILVRTADCVLSDLRSRSKPNLSRFDTPCRTICARKYLGLTKNRLITSIQHKSRNMQRFSVCVALQKTSFASSSHVI